MYTPMLAEYDAMLFDLFGTLVDDAANAMPGAKACLAALGGFPWAIVTSCSRSFARVLIAHAGLPPPPVLVAADDVTRNKPAPDGYLHAARELGVEPSRALVIEDTLQGIAAGRGAGMDVVAILRGRPSAFARAATYLVRDLASLNIRCEQGMVKLEV
jgi:sugar-phosphatase